MNDSPPNLLSKSQEENGIAVIGMACRFPGADNPEKFWHNILTKKESITFFDSAELLSSNNRPDLINHPDYVAARGIITEVDKFDASFFGYSPYEASLMDPQHRVFLELAWSALENAGTLAEKFPGLIGVFAGMNDSSYLINNLLKNNQVLAQDEPQHLSLATSSHYLCTKVAYALGLTGPCMTVNTACSTGLVSVALACENLISYNCDMALAGAITILVPEACGYVYKELGILSPDGHCRVFDKESKGTVLSNGCGIVVLKRLSDALQDKDHIIAVIKGWSVNNDGSKKAGFTAPSLLGQADCASNALAHAGVHPTEVEYLEAHGTGTLLGDPLEVSALTRAYAYDQHQKSQYCAIGSVKANIGHTDTAAGIAGFIKTALALQEKILPPTIHFETPNEKIDFTSSPYYVNCEAQPWETQHALRTAAVNALGFGGTNAHIILQEAPPVKTSASTPSNVLLFSAKTQGSLKKTLARMQEYLLPLSQQDPEHKILADTAYTLQLGRKSFKWRLALAYTGYSSLLKSLQELNKEPAKADAAIQELSATKNPRVFFGFPGQGAQYASMAQSIYEEHPFFRQLIDSSCQLLNAYLDLDLRELLFPKKENLEKAQQQLEDVRYGQPALFLIEYALAKLLMELGIKPTAMIGHSLGEYVAATLAGVISLEDAFQLIVARARLMAQTATGLMLAVPLSKEILEPFLKIGKVALAAHNAPNLCVVSGSKEEIEAFQKSIQALLDAKDLFCSALRTTHAFHSAYMDDIMGELDQLTENLSFQTPLIPYISNVTGTWILETDLQNKHYWANHMRQTVLFSTGIQNLNLTPEDIFIEVGPGYSLRQCLQQHQKSSSSKLLNTLPRLTDRETNSYCHFLQTLGQLWVLGKEILWELLYLQQERKRTPLPTYSFDSLSHWIAPDLSTQGLSTPRLIPPHEELLYAPIWQQDSLLSSRKKPLFVSPSIWLLFVDTLNNNPFLDQMKDQIYSQQLDFRQGAGEQGTGHPAIYTLTPGVTFRRLDDHSFIIDPQNKDHYAKVLAFIQRSMQSSSDFTTITHFKVLHTWLLDKQASDKQTLLQEGAYSLLYLSQTFTETLGDKNLEVLVLANEVYSVLGNEVLTPIKASLLGPCKVLPLEQENIAFKFIDLTTKEHLSSATSALWISNLIWEINHIHSNAPHTEIAYRGNYRWLRHLQPCKKRLQDNKIQRLKTGGVYLITGGLGGVGLTLAHHLAKHYQAHLILTARSAIIPEQEWSSWIDNHPSPSDQKIAKQIKALIKIKKEAGSLTIEQAAVEEESQMSPLIQRILQQFGHIDGVIHAAGIASGGVAQRKTVEEFNKTVQAKLKGTEILIQLLKEEPMDFFFLVSSITSITGCPGQIDYCSANRVLDAYALTPSFTHPVFCVSANWPAWREVGMAEDSETKLMQLDESNSLAPSQALELFETILQSNLNQVVISLSDPNKALPQIPNQNTLIPNKDKKTTEFFNQKHSALRETLTGLWCELLGIPNIGLDDDFYQLGGNSLLAISLLTKIRKQLHIKIPPSILFQAKTIGSLSQALEYYTQEEEHSPLVMLQEGREEEPPLFMVHPVGGTVFCYLPLVRTLKQNRTIYGIQDPSVEQEKPLFDTIEEMALCYLRKIQKIQPQGPYYLCGASFGAIVVSEMAYQLLEKNETLHFVGLIDSWATRSPNPTKIPAIDNQVFSEQMIQHRLHMMETYPIKKLNTKLCLFKAQDILEEYQPIEAPDNHWSPYSPYPLDIFSIPGDHNSMLQAPNACILAEALQQCLDEAKLKNSPKE